MNNRILICEPVPELEQILLPSKAPLHAVLISTTQIDAIPLLVQEHKPTLILLNSPNPKHMCHRLKMDPEFYSIPLFVFTEDDSEDLELQFLANEIFQKPFSVQILMQKTQRYLDKYELDSDAPLQTLTRDVWIEQKQQDGYFFEYIGTIARQNLLVLLDRISELLTVGRKKFTIKLVHAEHLENIPEELYTRIDQMVKQATGHVKFLITQSPLADSLNNQGLDIDQYIPGSLMDAFDSPADFPHPLD